MKPASARDLLWNSIVEAVFELEQLEYSAKQLPEYSGVCALRIVDIKTRLQSGLLQAGQPLSGPFRRVAGQPGPRPA